MKQENRLLKKRDFKKVLELKKRIWSKYFLCYYQPINDLTKVRIGILVTKKISKKQQIEIL